MSNNRIMLGRLGESFAEDYLIHCGYIIAAKNYRCRYGEIDLVACKGGVLYFVEVKTRRSMVFGTPAEAVNTEKRMHMRRTAACFLEENDYRGYSVEFKVIEIIINEIDDVLV
ncbi:MAG: YraN family protein [Emergencia sp.]